METIFIQSIFNRGGVIFKKNKVRKIKNFTKKKVNKTLIRLEFRCLRVENKTFFNYNLRFIKKFYLVFFFSRRKVVVKVDR